MLLEDKQNLINFKRNLHINKLPISLIIINLNSVNKFKRFKVFFSSLERPI